MEPSQTVDTWFSGDPYEQYMGRWSRQVAPAFLRWLNMPAARRWLDVGCGTGALSAAILESGSPASVIGVDPSDGFLDRARQRLAGRATFHRASASEIPLGDAVVDVTVSALVLNFLPDVLAALHEMARVTAGGGRIAAYVWDYAGRMDLIRIYWDAAAEVDPQAAKLDEGARFPLCRPDALVELFERAGLRQVEVTGIEIPMRFADFDDYWRPFLGGQGPAPTHAVGLGDAARNRLRERISERLSRQPDGTIVIGARAWAIRGTVCK